MMNLFRRLISDEKGQGLTEYALILAGIAIAVVVVLLLIGNYIQNVFGRVGNELSNVPGSS